MQLILFKNRLDLFYTSAKKKKKSAINQTSHYEPQHMLCEVFSESSLHLPHIITILFFIMAIILGFLYTTVLKCYSKYPVVQTCHNTLCFWD